jgi:D-alanyl-lipoteichoic acid acyltransferase DltB (MBOAT superfamily)
LWLVAAKSFGWGALFGISYMAFRVSYLAVEVYKQKIPAPSLWQFLGFIFFAPAVPSGPISPYKLYLEGFSKPLLLKEIWPEAFSRLFLGVLKFVFFASLLETLTYPHFLFNGRRHGVFDLSVSSIACYLMVYCRFSGLIDMMIGAAALAGFPLKENFDAPLTARNLQDYWNRWHISLLDYIREVVFVPLLHFGVRKFGLQRMWILAPLCTFVVFILVGLWHGTGFNYLLFGLYHAAGLSLAYWYGLFFKKFWPTKNAAYKKSKIAYAISWFITFLYVSYGFILAANSWSDIRQIFQDIFLWTW